MQVTLSLDQLNNMLLNAARLASSKTLQETGLLKKTITYSEVKKLYKSDAKAARMSSDINWKIIGKGGKTSGVYCSREELEKYMLNKKFDFNNK